MDKIKSAEIFLVLQIIFGLLSFASSVGLNYGRQGNNLQPSYYSVELLQHLNPEAVKLPNANHDILRMLSGTKLRVTITVENDLIPDIASNQTTADQWVHENVVAFYPETMIRFILVGNEVLSRNDTNLWNNLVPAMKMIHDSVRAHNIENIKIGTALAMDILESPTFPPSSGKFKSDIPHYQVLVPLLKFLDGTKSFFFLNVFPYRYWAANPTNTSLDFALFKDNQNSTYKDPGSGLTYTNLLDQMLDSVVFAARKLGYDNINPAISATGWPHDGDVHEPGANLNNSATYNRHLVRKMAAKPDIGTPARPKIAIPTFVSSLFDENLKEGTGTERNYGILRPNGLPWYDTDLTGAREDKDYMPIPPGQNNEPFKGKLWCVVADGVNVSELNHALNSVCSQGYRTCDAIAPGKECYEPVSIVAHASYAFSSYWAQFKSNASCFFNGLATEITQDPSHGSCDCPYVTF